MGVNGARSTRETLGYMGAGGETTLAARALPNAARAPRGLSMERMFRGRETPVRGISAVSRSCKAFWS